MKQPPLQGRKALSPLIATVLLIAFAVAVGTVIMNWSIGAGSDCANVEIEIPQGQAGICMQAEQKHLEFNIKNTGDHIIEVLRVQVIDEEGRFEGANLEIELETDGTVSPSIELATGKPTGLRAEFLPIIRTDEGLVQCEEKTITIEPVELCTE